jgi:hypothetical protein
VCQHQIKQKVSNLQSIWSTKHDAITAEEAYTNLWENKIGIFTRNRNINGIPGQLSEKKHKIILVSTASTSWTKTEQVIECFFTTFVHHTDLNIEDNVLDLATNAI